MSVAVRTAVAVVSLRHRPEVTATVDELERGGQPVTLVCLDRGAHDHDGFSEDLVHVPFLSAAIISSLLVHLTRDPLNIFKVLIRRLGPGGLLNLPRAVHLSRVLPRRGLTDMRPVDAGAGRVTQAIEDLSSATPPDLAELPVNWSELGVTRVGVRWFSRRINCIAAEVSVDGPHGRLIVKRQRGDAARTERERAVHEYQLLETLADLIGDERLTVPKALYFDERAATLVMEYARGKALDAIFGAAAADKTLARHLGEGVRGAGKWLAAMQKGTRRRTDGTELLSEVTEIAVRDAGTMAAKDRLFRRHHARIVETLHQLETRLKARPLIVAGHHGDYWPGNIFYDGEHVTVIDFEGFRDGLWLEDVAYFLIRCEMLERRFRLPLRNLASYFFDGYMDGRRPDGEALRLFTLTKGLRSLANGMGEDLPLPQRIWTRRTIRNCVMRAMRDEA